MFTNIFIKFDKLINLSNIKIKNLEELKLIIDYKSNLKKDSYYLIHNGKLFSNLSKLEDNDILEIILKTKGGELFFLGQIASITAVIAILLILMKPLIDIIKIVVMIIKIIGQILALFPQIIETILLIFNPKKFIDDIIFSISYGIKLVVGGMMDSMDSGTKSNSKETPDNVPKVCLPPSLFNLIILIICPPLALLINYGGIKGIFLTFVCALLTIWCYYFPGLIFAALHILC